MRRRARARDDRRQRRRAARASNSSRPATCSCRSRARRGSGRARRSASTASPIARSSAPARRRDAVAGACRARADARTPPGARPLAGVKVLDFTAFWAGPFATAWLAALGADVIKVEAVQRPDGIRFSAAVRPHQRPALLREVRCCSTRRTSASAGSRSISAIPTGSRIAKRLVARSDVLVENFTPRVLERFGLDYETVRGLRPDIVMLRMPAFGLTGPWRDRPGFAQTMEQLTGMAWVTGYDGGPPIIPGGLVDPMVGTHAALALVAALEHRDRTGEGQLRRGPARRGRDRGDRRAGDPLLDRRHAARSPGRGRRVPVRGRRRVGRGRPRARSARRRTRARRGARRATPRTPPRSCAALGIPAAAVVPGVRDARRPADASAGVLRDDRAPARRRPGVPDVADADVGRTARVVDRSRADARAAHRRGAARRARRAPKRSSRTCATST